MILVLASHGDALARRLTERWASDGARLLCPGDLSRAGWVHASGRPGGRGVAGGASFATRDLRGVLVRIPWVAPADLPHIVPADRAYVAAEMSAFLLAWLASLSCAVLGRPTPTCLSGPALRPEQWVRLALSAGVPAAPVRRTGAGPVPEPPGDVAAVTVVGARCLGPCSPARAAAALRLARAAGAELLSARFVGPPDAPCLTGADADVDLDDDAVAAAVREQLSGGGAS